ncbi:unnamed protein product [Lymnaea stagnalis]|uniref:Ferric-chelate reductase 1 n=1 Tax=Lymnaea stagnalis TaxID=6523 RepID=A0AAV2H7S0_LYMST
MDILKPTVYVILLLTVPNTWSYPHGAPIDTCMTMLPKHRGTQSQLDRSLYRVTVSGTSYRPGSTVKVTIDSPSRAEFKGVQVRAHSTLMNQEELVGEFTNLVPPDKLIHVSCQGKKRSMVSHSNNETVTSVTVDWTAPSQNIGPVIFDVTVVQSFFKFYFGLHSVVVQPDPSFGPIVQPTILASPIKSYVSPIDWSECGDTKGCLLYPRYCTGDDCKVGVSYRLNTTDSTARFELMGKVDGYLSLGFSHDMIMGEDQTISCSAMADTVTIQNGFNHNMKYNSRELRTNLTNLEAAKVDGLLMCRFTRPVIMNLDVYIEEFGDADPTPFTFDLADDMHLFLAWGKTYTLTDVIGYHYEMPVVSESKVNFSKNRMYRGSVMPRLIRAHASLMAVAWLGFAGLAIILARYYKDGFNDKKICGIKIWFHIHRISALMTFVLTVSGLILVLIKLDGKITQDESAHTHMCLGFTVVSLVCAQVLAGLLRPGLESKVRPIFNFFHRLLGQAALIISAATIIYAYKIADFTYEMQRFGERTVAVWAGFFVFFEILFVGYKYFASKVLVFRPGSDEYNLDKLSNNLEPDETTSPSHILLFCFIVFIACSITAALCMTIFF